MDGHSTSCFAELVKEIPKWLDEFNQLTQSVEKWRQRHSSEQDSAQPRRLKATSSTDSVRPIRASPRNEQHTLIRKRTVSGPWQKDGGSTSRKVVVVHYDTDVQKQVESLVNMISVGRGFIVKGKMATRRSPLSKFRADNLSGRIIHSDPSSLYRKRGNQSRIEDDSTDESNRSAKVLKQIESALLESQTLGEQISHQLLRDGDCDDNLEAMRACFESILEICMEQVSMSTPEDGEQANMKKQKCADISTTVTPTGAFGAEATMRILDVDEAEEADGFPLAIDMRLTTC